MNREDIICMAQEAGFSEWAVGLSEMPSHLERFAALVASAEREACAAKAEQVGQHKNHIGIAAAIRARGDKHD